MPLAGSMIVDLEERAREKERQSREAKKAEDAEIQARYPDQIWPDFTKTKAEETAIKNHLRQEYEKMEGKTPTNTHTFRPKTPPKPRKNEQNGSAAR